MVSRHDFLINELKRYFNSYGKIPTKRDLDANDDFPNYYEFAKVFNGLKNAIYLAGLSDVIKSKKMFNRKSYTDDQLLSILKDFITSNNIIPSAKEFNKNPSNPSSGLYNQRFGGFNAAIKILGYTEKYKHINKTNEELLEELYEFYIKTGEIPHARNLIMYGYSSPTIYSNRFGSLYNAYRLAKIPYNKTVRELNKEEIIEYWYDLKTSLGRMPTIIDMQKSEINIHN